LNNPLWLLFCLLLLTKDVKNGIVVEGLIDDYLFPPNDNIFPPQQGNSSFLLEGDSPTNTATPTKQPSTNKRRPDYEITIEAYLPNDIKAQDEYKNGMFKKLKTCLVDGEAETQRTMTLDVTDLNNLTWEEQEINCVTPHGRHPVHSIQTVVCNSSLIVGEMENSQPLQQAANIMEVREKVMAAFKDKHSGKNVSPVRLKVYPSKATSKVEQPLSPRSEII
jgi:hypothetical protein